MRVKSTVAVATTAALAVVLAACGGGGGGGGTAPPAQSQQSLAAEPQYNPQPYDNIKDGGTLTTDIIEINAQFNNFHGDGTLYTRWLWNWYNPVLISFSPTGDTLLNKDFLTDAQAETVGGNTKITYTINPKATYNDGAPIDWTSFESTWKASNGKNEAYVVSSTDGYDRITSVVRGVDDRQAVVTFDGINVWWQGLFNNLLNPKALDPEVFNKGYVDTPHAEWGAGPYTIQKLDKNTGVIVFERNPKWWGDKGKLDTRTFQAMDTTASVNAFKNGQLDATQVPSAELLSQVKDMQGIDIRRSTLPQVFLYTLNSTAPNLTDPMVRKAIFEGIDRDQINKIAFQGLDYTEKAPGSLSLSPFQKGYADNFPKVLTYNPDQAKKDLDAAGWVPGPDGIRVKDGKQLTISYVRAGDSATGKAMGTAAVAMLKDIGVLAEYKQVPRTEFGKILNGKTFDIFLSGFIQSDPFGLAYFCQIWCSDSTLNKSSTNVASFDDTVKSVNKLPTADEQFAKANEIEIEALKTYGLMPLQNGPDIWATKKGLANFGASMFFTALPQNVGWQK